MSQKMEVVRVHCRRTHVDRTKQLREHEIFVIVDIDGKHIGLATGLLDHMRWDKLTAKRKRLIEKTAPQHIIMERRNGRMLPSVTELEAWELRLYRVYLKV